MNAVYVVLILFMSSPALADCTTPAGVAGENRWFSGNSDMKYCDGTNWISMTVAVTGTACSEAGKISVSGTDIRFCNGSFEVSMNGMAMTACTAPESGTFIWDSALLGMKWCDGTNWRRMTNSLGYFVRYSIGRNGSLGGLAGANAKCLQDLTDNDFLGKSNAILDAAHVKAFLCDSTSCQNLRPWTTYTFAVSGAPTDGGSTFVTNASGHGPSNGTRWNGVTTLNTSTAIWVGRTAGTSTVWGASAQGGCSSWTAGGSGPTGRSGSPNNTDSKRWYDASVTCDTLLYFVCAVNPY